VPFVVPALAIIASLRIVSLAPALTEDLFAIGAGADVVGVDAFSDRPPAARRVPRVGGMRDVNAEAIVALHPDVVIGIPWQAPSLADVARGGVRTEALRLDGLDDDFRAIARLGALTGHRREASALVTSIRARLAATARDARRTRTLTAFVALGGMGTAGAGSYVDTLLGLANLRNVAGDVHRPWVMLSPEVLLRAQPDVLVVPDTTPPFAGEPWNRLSAVRAGRIVRVTEDDLLRPGPRVADALDAIVRGARRWR